MNFPKNEGIKSFCESVEKLVGVRAGGLYKDGLCECEIDTLCHYLNEGQAKDLINGLFWGVLFDQVVEKTAEEDLYAKFKNSYYFPKFYDCKEKGKHASPDRIINGGRVMGIPDKGLFVMGGQEFTAEMLEWAKSVGDVTLVDKITAHLKQELKKQGFRVDLDSIIGK